MLIDKSKCVNCGLCMEYCPVGAIKKVDGVVNIDFDECVECGVCERSKVCRKEAIYRQELTYPRVLRYIMSDELSIAPKTGISGRGTEEQKTNDVTGRFESGYCGVAIELGRPFVGTRVFDLERMAMAVAEAGVVFEDENPITEMMEDLTTGKFKEELLCERFLSGIVEFKIPIEKLEGVLTRIIEESKKIHTVFSLGVCSKVEEDGTIPHMAILDKMGLWVAPNGKVNVGLGRPLHIFNK